MKSTDISSAGLLTSLLKDVACNRVTSSAGHNVAIGLGSNLGDRFANIEHALRLLENPYQLLDPAIVGDDAKVAVVDTSFMYETEPMYMTDQPSFINCACLVCFPYHLPRYSVQIDIFCGTRSKRTSNP
jgi:dihydroneopterin aldolase / 2-amino-4-hydroxy-6-hydroxymethyldihydropteridine diphosphokinase / dihydropteroate synthase